MQKLSEIEVGLKRQDSAFVWPGASPSSAFHALWFFSVAYMVVRSKLRASAGGPEIWFECKQALGTDTLPLKRLLVGDETSTKRSCPRVCASLSDHQHSASQEDHSENHSELVAQCAKGASFDMIRFCSELKQQCRPQADNGPFDADSEPNSDSDSDRESDY